MIYKLIAISSQQKNRFQDQLGYYYNTVKKSDIQNFGDYARDSYDKLTSEILLIQEEGSLSSVEILLQRIRKPIDIKIPADKFVMYHIKIIEFLTLGDILINNKNQVSQERLFDVLNEMLNHVSHYQPACIQHNFGVFLSELLEHFPDQRQILMDHINNYYAWALMHREDSAYTLHDFFRYFWSKETVRRPQE